MGEGSCVRGHVYRGGFMCEGTCVWGGFMCEGTCVWRRVHVRLSILYRCLCHKLTRTMIIP